jgi:hypothetical protein
MLHWVHPKRRKTPSTFWNSALPRAKDEVSMEEQTVGGGGGGGRREERKTGCGVENEDPPIYEKDISIVSPYASLATSND